MALGVLPHGRRPVTNVNAERPVFGVGEGTELHAPERFEVVVDLVEEFFDNDCVIFFCVFDPLVEAWRWMPATAGAI